MSLVYNTYIFHKTPYFPPPPSKIYQEHLKKCFFNPDKTWEYWKTNQDLLQQFEKEYEIPLVFCYLFPYFPPFPSIPLFSFPFPLLSLIFFVLLHFYSCQAVFGKKYISWLWIDTNSYHIAQNTFINLCGFFDDKIFPQPFLHQFAFYYHCCKRINVCFYFVNDFFKMRMKDDPDPTLYKVRAIFYISLHCS